MNACCACAGAGRTCCRHVRQLARMSAVAVAYGAASGKRVHLPDQAHADATKRQGSTSPCDPVQHKGLAVPHAFMTQGTPGTLNRCVLLRDWCEVSSKFRQTRGISAWRVALRTHTARSGIWISHAQICIIALHKHLSEFRKDERNYAGGLLYTLWHGFYDHFIHYKYSHGGSARSRDHDAPPDSLTKAVGRSAQLPLGSPGPQDQSPGSLCPAGQQTGQWSLASGAALPPGYQVRLLLAL